MLFEIPADKYTWCVVYDKAVRDNGELFFPERLTESFLLEQRKVLGPYIFANQYQNEILPAEDQDFKPSWIKHHTEVPEGCYTFAFVDPAISQQDTADFTAYVIVKIDYQGFWYVERAVRQRINATDTIKLIFDINEEFKPMAIGVETVAYQKALLHFLNEEMLRRGTVLPVTGVQRGPNVTKERRILSLVPRYEWGRISHRKGLDDLEDEMLKFPRSAYDDLLDALASIEEIAFLPTKEKEEYVPRSPHDKGYESYIIRQSGQQKSEEEGY